MKKKNCDRKLSHRILSHCFSNNATRIDLIRTKSGEQFVLFNYLFCTEEEKKDIQNRHLKWPGDLLHTEGNFLVEKQLYRHRCVSFCPAMIYVLP